jgi:DNA-binding NarL/FixJ family response regulator
MLPSLRVRPDARANQLCDSSMMRRTVLIVDDHPAFRAAARALLEAADFEVVGEAADSRSALAAVAALSPEVVLLDVYLPDGDGFAVAEQLARDGGGAAIVLTSSRSAMSFRRRLAANPSWKFIAKSELSGEAVAAAVAG